MNTRILVKYTRAKRDILVEDLNILTIKRTGNGQNIIA